MGISRRDFSKLSFLYSLGSLISPQTTFAKKPEQIEDFYLQINLFGAPSRWQYDLPITPFDGDKVKENGHVITSLNIRDDQVTSSYKTNKINGINLPPLWSEKLDILGKSSSQSEIYNNMLTIRGCDMAIDGHEINSRKLVNPFGTGNSLTGHISNMSKAPYPAIQLLGKASPLSTAPGAFHSTLGINPINIAYNESYGKSILSFGKYEKYLQIEDRILNILEGRESKNRKSVTKLLKKNLDEIFDFYENRVKSYEKIIKANTKFSKEFKNLPGYQFKRRASDYETDSIRSMLGEFYIDGYFLCGENLTDMAKDLDYSDLAKRFAISETIIKYDLSSSCLMMVNPVEGLNIKGAYLEDDLYIEKSSGLIVPKKGIKPRTIKRDFTFDPHDIGLITETIMNDQFYRCFQSCLLDFVQTLKKQGKFDKTLIHITSEFDRTPRLDLSGSDHGWQGHTSTFITGKISGSYVTGNIYVDNPRKDALHFGNGTWGAAAPNKELQNRHMSYRNIISTISNFLDIKSITPSDMALISIKNDKKVNLLLGDAKNV